MLVRPTTSRMALSATALMVPSGFWTLNRKFAAPMSSDEPGAAGFTIQNTAKSTSTMFSSPVSIKLSSATSRMEAPRRGSSPVRMPMSMRLTRVTCGVSTVSIG